ncbi:unnamed protein product [Ceutorhynchus assimilis]|uniref:Peptidase A2 domain-containing protein n=1 Tax=Ceutorhynchus assimilis TaxID=467358 RepID=A0A9N9MW57_9CUCU|nr:unnamed protein product [Ceutorhynchus assimilis]
MPGDDDKTAGSSLEMFANVQAPAEFNFSQPQQWPQWKKRFERYMSVSGFGKKSNKEKIDMLIYLMGCRERPGEPVENFITSLHALAEHCDYGALKEELIRDRIVIGVANEKVSERLQLRDKLILCEAITAVRQAELQGTQNKIIRQEQSVSAIKSSSQNTGQNFKSKEMPSASSRVRTKRCAFCGLSTCEDRAKCPAKSSICRACAKRGHWSVMCRNKKSVRAVEHSDSELSSEEQEQQNVSQVTKDENGVGNFIGQVYLDKQDRWYVDILLDNKHKIPFFVDTGADVSCFPYELLPDEFISKLILCEPVGASDNHRLDTVGKIKVNLTYEGKTNQETVYVVRKLRQPILGRNAIISFKVLNFPTKNVCLISDYNFNCRKNQDSLSKFTLESISRQFQGIFSEIGQFKNKMSIQIKPNAKPFVQSVPRTVPLALLPKLKTELDRLLKLNIIEPIETPTTWVSPIVCVDKGDTVRLCCDYTKLNESVLRSHFPLPKIEHTLSQLSGSKYFSKLDTTSGFYQIKLNEESQLLTTFITPYGRCSHSIKFFW